MSGQLSQDPVLVRLARLLAAPVAEQDRARAGWRVLDWLGCAAAGAQAPSGRLLRATQGPGSAGRAFTWGGLGNVLEMDDVDRQGVLHPGPVVVAATLALALELETGAEAALEAIVRGYEAMIRLGRAVGRGHYALWHPTGTCGPIGAAAACASLLGLDPKRSAQALALAVSQAAGLWATRHEPASMGKQLHAAHAARAGLEAARLAQAGFTGPLQILESPQGFFAAACPDGAAEDVLRAYAPPWLLQEVSFKPWPACRHAHPAIDAALALWAQGPPPRAVPDIELAVYADAARFCDQPAPKTEIEAKFSLQHAVAVALVRGPPRLEDFTLAAIADPALAAVRARVRVRVEERLEARYPAHYGAVLRAHGRTVEAADALGDPENPLTPEQLAAKARALLLHAGAPDGAAEALVRMAAWPDPDFLRALVERLG